MRYKNLITTTLLVLVLLGCDNSQDSAGLNSTGQGGSMTRFAIHNSFMYVADSHSIQVFSIEENAFAFLSQVEVAFGLETIFAKGDYLYLGASDAMYIYSIQNPADPTFVFRYSHIVSCDPVVVQGDRAYVTLRTGTACNEGVNALEILDISDKYHPKLIRNYPMESPHGLGVLGNFLFLCEGNKGLKVFDITNETDIVLLKKITTIHAYDVIVREGIATVTGEDGIFQYAFPHAEQIIRLMSKIEVNRSEI